MIKDSMQLNTQLLERKRNLQVIDDVIQADQSRSHRLIEVREFLVHRIDTIEKELAMRN